MSVARRGQIILPVRRLLRITSQPEVTTVPKNLMTMMQVNLLQCCASMILHLQTDTVITEFFEVENDDISNAGEEDMDVDIGKKNIIYVVCIE